MFKLVRRRPCLHRRGPKLSRQRVAKSCHQHLHQERVLLQAARASLAVIIAASPVALCQEDLQLAVERSTAVTHRTVIVAFTVSSCRPFLPCLRAFLGSYPFATASSSGSKCPW